MRPPGGYCRLLEEGPIARISIIVLTRNQKDKTLRCLRSLREVTTPAHEVLLWDNGSDDGTAHAVKTAFPQVLVRRHPTNLGAAAGRNAAVRLAVELFDPECFLFLDNDAVVTERFLEQLAAVLGSDPRLALVTAKIRLLGAPELIEHVGCRVDFGRAVIAAIGLGELDRGQYDHMADCIAASGCILVRRTAFEAVGGFDGRFDPYGFEDLDLSLRFVKAGYRVVCAPEAVVFHERNPRFGRKYSPWADLHRARNWLYLAHRHADRRQLAAFYLLGMPSLVGRRCQRLIAAPPPDRPAGKEA